MDEYDTSFWDNYYGDTSSDVYNFDWGSSDVEEFPFYYPTEVSTSDLPPINLPYDQAVQDAVNLGDILDPTSTSAGATALKKVLGLFTGDTAGSAGQLASFAGLAGILNSLIGSSSNQPTGYQGSIPDLGAGRKQYALPPSEKYTGPDITKNQLAGYLSQPGLTDAQIVTQMQKYGVSPTRMAELTNQPVENIMPRYTAALGPNMNMAGTPRRPGSGGITYFSPMSYVQRPTAAADTATNLNADGTVVDTSGDVQSAAGGGIMSIGSYSDGGRLARGPGDGVSDDIPAMIGNSRPAKIADGEFVVPARIVSEIGNGSTDAGARKLYKMMDNIQQTRRSTKDVAADTRAERFFPKKG